MHEDEPQAYDPEVVARLEALPEQLERAFRDIGLYTPDAEWVPAERPTLAMVFLIGDVAFTERVQNPEQHDIDAEFSLIQREFVADEFERIRKELGA